MNRYYVRSNEIKSTNMVRSLCTVSQTSVLCTPLTGNIPKIKDLQYPLPISIKFITTKALMSKLKCQVSTRVTCFCLNIILYNYQSTFRGQVRTTHANNSKLCDQSSQVRNKHYSQKLCFGLLLRYIKCYIRDSHRGREDGAWSCNIYI